jgi:hypothetical protein
LDPYSLVTASISRRTLHVNSVCKSIDSRSFLA